MIDIVINTCKRPLLLAETIGHIQERTHTPYALHVIDDGSEDGFTYDLLLRAWLRREIETVLLRGQRHGRMPARNVATWLAFSDPFVLVDDDILCPDINPDWLTCGLIAMQQRPQLGILALHHPTGSLQRPYAQDEHVTYCQYVGNTFMFVRRAVVENWHHPHFRHNLGVIDEMQRCDHARELGYQVGYLTDVFCQHIGRVNADGGPGSGVFIQPLDPFTLRPAEEHIWRPA